MRCAAVVLDVIGSLCLASFGSIVQTGTYCELGSRHRFIAILILTMILHSMSIRMARLPSITHIHLRSYGVRRLSTH